jgi:hypothetical protein
VVVFLALSLWDGHLAIKRWLQVLNLPKGCTGSLDVECWMLDVECFPPVKLLLALFLLSLTAPAAPPQLLESKLIWKKGSDPALTDLARWRDAWWCVFRESSGLFKKPDGKIRIVTSRDGTVWESVAFFSEKDVDFDAPRLSVTPQGRLMLVFNSDLDPGLAKPGTPQPMVAFSTDGRQWSAPKRVLEEGEELGRVTWQGETAYVVSRSKTPPDDEGRINEWILTLHKSGDGISWTSVAQLKVPDFPAEATLRFRPDGECLALVQRMRRDKQGWLGKAKAPYTNWQWQPVGRPIGGANFLVMAKGNLIVAGQSDQLSVITALGFLDEKGWQPTLALRSGFRFSYTGMVEHEGFLWISYLSHSGEILLGKVQL